MKDVCACIEMISIKNSRIESQVPNMIEMFAGIPRLPGRVLCSVLTIQHDMKAALGILVSHPLLMKPSRRAYENVTK
jgi:hypothetical protein